MDKNTHIRFSVTLPKEHAKYLRQFALDSKTTQTDIVRKVLKSWIEKKLVPRYPDIDGTDALVDELETLCGSLL